MVSSPFAEDVKGNVLEAVLLELVVGFENAPDRKDVSAGEVERRRLIESPAVRLRVAEPAGVAVLDPAELWHEVPACGQ